jgi:hypothetical protein
MHATPIKLFKNAIGKSWCDGEKNEKGSRMLIMD